MASVVGRASEEDAQWFVRKYKVAALGSRSVSGERRVVSEATGKDKEWLVKKFMKLKTAVLFMESQSANNDSCMPCGNKR